MIEVFATGDAGRRLVHRIWKRERKRHYTIARINFKGQIAGLETGTKTLDGSKLVSRAILESQRYRDIEFKAAETLALQSAVNGE